MATSTLLAPNSSRSRFKAVLWIFLGLTTLFVFITSEVLLVIDYPMYHAYRLQVIADRHLLIPHTLCGVIALLAGPVQFLVAPSPASHPTPSRPWPGLRHLRLYRRRNRSRPRNRPSRLPRNLWAGRSLGRLYRRRFHHRAQPPNRPASSVDDPFLRCHIHVRLQPCAQPLAPLLEPPWRHPIRRRCHRLHSCVAADRGPRSQLA